MSESKPLMEAKKSEHPKRPDSKYFPAFFEALPDQTGKVVVITGTTSGTGKVAGLAALKKGATVALLNRNIEKAQKAVGEYLDANPDVKERVFFIKCDLQDFESVRNAAAELKGLFGDKGIDVVCNNAGVMGLADEATKDGYDVQMQTNHLSHFLLTKEIFPLLKKCAEKNGDARVVNHTSVGRLYPATPLKSKYLQKNGGKLGGNGNNMMIWVGGRYHRYHQTKLANSVFTRELQKHCNKAGIKVKSLCAHPGLAFTELQLTAYKDGGMSGLGFMKASQSAEDGAMGILKAMFDANVKPGALYGPFTMTGKATKRRHGMLSTNRAGRMLWRESEKACGEFDVSA